MELSGTPDLSIIIIQIKHANQTIKRFTIIKQRSFGFVGMTTNICFYLPI